MKNIGVFLTTAALALTPAIAGAKTKHEPCGKHKAKHSNCGKHKGKGRGKIHARKDGDRLPRPPGGNGRLR